MTDDSNALKRLRDIERMVESHATRLTVLEHPGPVMGALMVEALLVEAKADVDQQLLQDRDELKRLNGALRAELKAVREECRVQLWDVAETLRVSADHQLRQQLRAELDHEKAKVESLLAQLKVALERKP
jgi:hypothetical protein